MMDIVGNLRGCGLFTACLLAAVGADSPAVQAPKPSRNIEAADRPRQARSIILTGGPELAPPALLPAIEEQDLDEADAAGSKPADSAGREISSDAQTGSNDSQVRETGANTAEAVPLLESLLGKGGAPEGPKHSKPNVPAKPDIPKPSIFASTPSGTDSRATSETAVAAESDLPPITKPRNPLDRRVDEAIAITQRRTLEIGKHTPWQIGHGMLAYRENYMLKKGSELVDAFDWVATNPVYLSHTPNPNTGAETRRLPWFFLTEHGARPQRYTGRPKEFEGHPSQFLAFFALARIPLDFEFTINGRTVTYGQMLYNAKMEVNDREEVTWTLWTFSYYFDSDERWVNASGEQWSMSRLVSTTLKQFSPTRSPCGGCHALFALASARNAYMQSSGQRLSGVWLRAHMHLREHAALAKSMQNPDGSFSSNYFKGPGQAGQDPNKRISTSGHTLEFLMVTLPQDRLDEPWVQKAVNRVATDLVEYQNEALDPGGMYHAVHALVLYRERTRPASIAGGAPAKESTGPARTARGPYSGRRMR